MTSSINPNNIDGQYPVAGQDNDSQGFRDNFTNIRNNLTFAKTELEDLQQNVLLKGALSGQVLDNEMSNSQLKGVQCLRFTETIDELGPLSGTVTIDWQQAHFHVLETAGTIELDFTGWPTSGFFTKLRLEINVTSVAHTLTLPTDVTVGVNGIRGASYNSVTSKWTITFTQTGYYQFEFSTYDNGTTVSMRDLTRNYNPNLVDYQYLTPTAGSYANISQYASTVIIDPNGTIASANINFPANTTVVNGQTISFGFGNTITTATMFGNGATIRGSLTTANTSSPVKYMYNSSSNFWYRIG